MLVSPEKCYLLSEPKHGLLAPGRPAFDLERRAVDVRVRDGGFQAGGGGVHRASGFRLG